MVVKILIAKELIAKESAGGLESEIVYRFVCWGWDWALNARC
jgi:hypothetical protein